jgi:hypothetical protein
LKKIEFKATNTEVEDLKGTLPADSSKSALLALRKTVELYLRLRNVPGNQQAETNATQYLEQIKKTLD